MLYEELAAELLKYQFILFRKEGNKNTIDILRGKKRVIGYLFEVKDGVSPSVLSDFMDKFKLLENCWFRLVAWKPHMLMECLPVKRPCQP